MSRVRTGHQPDDWSSNEPAVGRIHMTRYGMRGAFVVGQKPTPLPVTSMTPERRLQAGESTARRKAGELCGRSRPGGTCARVAGHGWECRTAASMARIAARKRAATS